MKKARKLRNEGVPWWFSGYDLVFSLPWPKFGHSPKQKKQNKKEHKSIRANKNDPESKLED